MKSAVSTAAIVLLSLATVACNKMEPSNPANSNQSGVSEADATKVADATVETWKSMDAARIKALYAPSVVAFDFAVPGLNKDRAEFDKRQDAYVAAKLNGAKEVERKIQVLSPNAFVMSGTWDMTSTATPANNGIVRCTDVFQKDDSGNWPIVNEHCSPAPKAG